MAYYYVPVKSENIPNSHELSIGYTEYHPTGKQQQPHNPVKYQQATSTAQPTYPVIISQQIIQQASPPDSPRSLCSSSDENHQKSNSVMPPKKKRTRTAFNNFQVVELEREYRRSMYMQRERRQEVAQRLSLEENHIKIWFQNRRMRYKREGMLSQKNKQQERVPTENISNKSSDHKNIVKRFMSYSQDTLTPASIESHQPQLQNLLPPSPPPTESAELTEILDLLADSLPATIPPPSSELSRNNFTEILDYLQETSPPTSKLATPKESNEFVDIVEYLTESSSPPMPLKEDSELSEILNYLVESSPITNVMNSSEQFPIDDDANLKKIKNELELSAENWLKHSRAEITIPLIPDQFGNSIH